MQMKKIISSCEDMEKIYSYKRQQLGPIVFAIRIIPVFLFANSEDVNILVMPVIINTKE